MTACAVIRPGLLTSVQDLGRFSAVRWGVAGDIVTAWLMTLPAAAAIGAATYLFTDLFPGALGPLLVSAAGLAGVGIAFARRVREVEPAAV